MDNDDFKLFKEEMSGVVRLSDEDSTHHKKELFLTPGQLYRRKAAEDFFRDGNFLPTSFVNPLNQYDILSYKRDGVQNGVFRKLKRGDYPIEAALDLHKASVEKARTAVYQFILDCHHRGIRSAAIRHGKGINSQQPVALLKSFVARWLPLFREVLAFHSAQNQHGGVGAVYVLLRKGEKQKEINRRRFGLCG